VAGFLKSQPGAAHSGRHKGSRIGGISYCIRAKPATADIVLPGTWQMPGCNSN